MELVFVTVIAAGIGAVVRYLLPGRDAYGILLLSAVSAATTAAVWVALVWLGFTFDGGWIWVISLLAGTIAPIVVALLLPRRRRAADDVLFERLSSPQA